MTASSDAIDRWCELANIGAGHAAGALATLIGQPIRMRVPQVVHRDTRAAEAVAEPAAGIFFDVIGGIGGDFAVFLTREACADLVRVLLGDASLESDDAASALSEVGNVLASHALSAVADQIGSTILPSIPDVALENPNAAFHARIGDRSPQIENALEDEHGRARGALVWIPAQTEADGGPRADGERSSSRTH